MYLQWVTLVMPQGRKRNTETADLPPYQANPVPPYQANPVPPSLRNDQYVTLSSLVLYCSKVII